MGGNLFSLLYDQRSHQSSADPVSSLCFCGAAESRDGTTSEQSEGGGGGAKRAMQDVKDDGPGRLELGLHLDVEDLCVSFCPCCVRLLTPKWMRRRVSFRASCLVSL